MSARNLDAITKKPSLFAQLDDAEKTEEICLMAVSANGSNLEFVPESMASEKVLLRAIQSESHALAYVNFEKQRKDFLENLSFVAISFAPTALEYVPHSQQSERLVHEACSRLPLALCYVADSLKTATLCHKAIEKDVKALKFTPPDLLTNELIEACLNKSPWAIGDLPPVCMTKDRLLRCTKRAGQVIRDIPVAHHTEELYRIAFDQDPMSICHMKDHQLRNKVVGEAIAQDWPFDYEYEPQNPIQAKKFLAGEKAKHSPHLAFAYEVFLSTQGMEKTPNRPRHSSQSAGSTFEM